MPVPDEAQIRANIGEGLFAAGLDYAAGDAQKAQIIFDEYRKEARQEFTIKDKPVDPLFPGAKAALEDLAASGWLLGIVTNKGRHGLSQMMERHDIAPLIDVSFTADDVAVKPAPDMAIAAIDKYGIAPEAPFLSVIRLMMRYVLKGHRFLLSVLAGAIMMMMCCAAMGRYILPQILQIW